MQGFSEWQKNLSHGNMYELVKTTKDAERKEIHMKTKLTTKDLITAGAFGAIYLVLLTVLSSVLTLVPILFLAICR